MPNDGKDEAEQAKKIQIGLDSGASDLILLRPNEALFIEVKTETGTQSKAQKKWQKTVEALGFKYIIVRSVEDFWNKIK